MNEMGTVDLSFSEKWTRTIVMDAVLIKITLPLESPLMKNKCCLQTSAPENMQSWSRNSLQARIVLYESAVYSNLCRKVIVRRLDLSLLIFQTSPGFLNPQFI